MSIPFISFLPKSFCPLLTKLAECGIIYKRLVKYTMVAMNIICNNICHSAKVFARGEYEKYKFPKNAQAYFGKRRMLRIGFVFDEPLRTPTYSTKFHTQAYRSGHNEAVLKTSFVCLCNFLKTLDFIGFFASSNALCEKRFSQFSRNFP